MSAACCLRVVRALPDTSRACTRRYAITATFVSSRSRRSRISACTYAAIIRTTCSSRPAENSSTAVTAGRQISWITTMTTVGRPNGNEWKTESAEMQQQTKQEQISWTNNRRASNNYSNRYIIFDNKKTLAVNGIVDLNGIVNFFKSVCMHASVSVFASTPACFCDSYSRLWYCVYVCVCVCVCLCVCVCYLCVAVTSHLVSYC